jgi:hypothetical protein
MEKNKRPSFATATTSAVATPSEVSLPTILPVQKIQKVKKVQSIKIPISNKISPDAFVRLHQLAAYGGEDINEVLESAINAYYASKPQVHQPLPEKLMNKLRSKFPQL